MIRKYISFLFLFFFLLNSSNVFSKNLQAAIYYYSVAMINFYNRDFKLTEKFLSKAIDNDPDSVYLNYKMATFYLHFQNVPKAIEYCERTLLINPDFDKAHELLANIYSATNNLKGAIKEYKFLLGRKPDNPNLLLRYGVFLLRGEEFDKAKKCFRKLLKYNKYKAMAYFYLGKTYSRLKLYKDALKYYEESIKVNPEFQQSFYEIALVYQILGNDKKAYETYKKVLKINPDNILAREKIVRYLVKKNDLKDALKHLEKLKDLEGDNFNINIKLALIYMELKQYNKAINILKNFNQFPKAQYYLITIYLKLDKVSEATKVLFNIDNTSPFYYDSAVLIINYLIDEREYSRALNIYLKVIDNLVEKNIKVYKFGLYLFDKAHEYKKGIDFLNEAIEKYPDVSQFYFFKGLFYDKLGDTANVIKSMKKAIDVNPSSADSLNYLAYTYAIHKTHLKEAEELAKKALKLKPQNAAITDTLGWIYYQMGNYNEALNVLREAYRMNRGQEPEIIYHLGVTYLKVSDKENGLKLLNEALKKCNDKKLKEKILKAIKEAK